MIEQLAMKKDSGLVLTAVIIAIVLGLATSAFFLVVNKDSNSAIYIIPDSIAYNSNDNSVFYTYGVKSSESGKMDYTLKTYLNESNIKTKQFSLNRGEILDERERIMLPANITYPSKISLRLSTLTSEEEVHFWLKE